MAFLLDPVAAVKAELFDIGNECRQVLRAGDRVAKTVDHQCRLIDDGIDICEQVPVAVEVAVPVDATGEP